ncbi:MAG: hypothetical protein U0R44_00510 [Candidatus Micrarchaeia archaeon]
MCDLSQFGYSCPGYYGYQYSCIPHGDNNPPPTHVSVDVGCDGNTVTVTSDGHPVKGTHVNVKDPVTLDSLASGDTDNDGKFTFDLGKDMCGEKVLVKVEGEPEKSVTLEDCNKCAPPECTTDDQCPTDKKCSTDNKCVPVPCSCGVVESHQCKAYACCADSDCPTDQQCVGHACKPKDNFQCHTDLQCKDNQFCDIKPGAAGGACKDITGQCGQPKDHKFVPYGYECGTEPGCPQCPQGKSCVDHKCLSNDINCPSTAIVGDNKTCVLTENDQACGPGQNCTAKVTTPDGKEYDVTPDENGNVQVPASISGKIKVTLLKDGKVVKEVFINVLPKSAPEEPSKPPSQGSDPFSLLWLLILLLAVILGIVYWRSRGGKK